jgi:hypothetical protein
MESSRIARRAMALALAMTVALPAWAADVPGTKLNGKSVQEPPPPPREGNPFPRNPDKPGKNPLRDEKRDMNPTNDPDVAKGIRDNYERHQSKKK